MLLAAMLAMVLAVALPATAQKANSGNSQNVLSFSDSGPTDDVGIGGGVLSEDACHDDIVDSLVRKRGISRHEAAELLERVRESASAKKFDKLVQHFCNQ